MPDRSLAPWQLIPEAAITEAAMMGRQTSDQASLFYEFRLEDPGAHGAQFWGPALICLGKSGNLRRADRHYSRGTQDARLP